MDNDIAPHYGGFETSPVNNKDEHKRNNLTNKQSAMLRCEPKDYVDSAMSG